MSGWYGPCIVELFRCYVQTFTKLWRGESIIFKLNIEWQSMHSENIAVTNKSHQQTSPAIIEIHPEISNLGHLYM